MAVDDIDLWGKCANCCCPSPPQPPQRTININRQVNLISADGKEEQYPDNRVITFRYTWWNFLPKNLLEQFMRVANTYFLITAIIQIANPDSPTSWVTSVFPLIFVLAVTAVKQGYEDYLRHREDRKVNHRPVELVRDARIEVVRAEALRVGDIIRVVKNDPFPCDMILLSSAMPTGECFVTTAGLDGETNLKTYRSMRETKVLSSAESLWKVRGTIECEQPTVHLYKFTGRAAFDVRTMDGMQDSKIAPTHAANEAVTTQPTSNGVSNEAFESNGDETRVNDGPGFTNVAFAGSQSSVAVSSIIALRANDPNVRMAPLDEKNLLLRGARLRNTEFVFGCVVYTGPETKLALNSRGKRMKMSCIEKRLNVYLIIMFSFLIIITSLCTGLVYNYRNAPVITSAWYLLPTVPDPTAAQGVIEWLNYFVLFSYLIPISLYVVIELQKFIGSLFFGWDLQMYEAKRKERAQANTSDLNEELGQVQYLFSDKTGTLTENEMLFRECAVNGCRYVDRDCKLFTRVTDGNAAGDADLTPLTRTDDHLFSFLKVLALCHTCRVECADSENVQNEANRIIFRRESSIRKSATKSNTVVWTSDEETDKNVKMVSVSKSSELVSIASQINASTLTAAESTEMKASGALYEYQASSPDEKALLIAARRYGVVYHGIVDDNEMLISVNRTAVANEEDAAEGSWTFERYQLLHVLEFDSTRKCMSVIVKSASGDYFLMTKGAETSMFERAAAHTDEQQREIMSHVAEYATRGLRTLVIGQRSISSEEFVELDRKLRNAQLAISDRETALQSAYRAIEKDLQLLGATGVEDRLQDGVGETIGNIRKAGIVVWVLTGDKEETAVNIAQSCALFADDMRLLRFTQQANSAMCASTLQTLQEQTVLENNRSAGNTNRPDYGLVIDGASLAFVLDRNTNEHERLKQLLIDLCLKCTSVLCCRVTPLQKAEIVKLVKRSVKGAITAAIGDGANDVSMIQEAHVGLGIFGMEGRQAAQTSDYCFARFRHLNRVLLLHGHFYYHRLSILVLYFFYKNIVYTINLFFYQYLCAFSQVSLYDSMSLALFNVTYATLPILAFGVCEQHIHRDLLLRKPELYKLPRHNATLSLGNFFRWQLLALYDAAVIAFGTYIYFQFTTEGTLPDGQALDSYTYGAFTLVCVILVVNIRLMIETRFWSAFAFGSFSITIFLGFFGILLLYEGKLWTVTSLDYQYFVLEMALAYPVTWLLCAVIVIACLLPDLLAKAIIDTRSSEGKLQLENMVLRNSSSRVTVQPTPTFEQPLHDSPNDGKLNGSAGSTPRFASNIVSVDTTSKF